MIEQQQKLILSPYIEIYELVVPKDNLLRQIKELVDFEFIYNELLDKYCLDNGRNAVPPIRMFKYLLLKAIYDLSDVDVVERSKYDMSFKYFLDMAPEETVINPSSLTKFRKLRLKDMNLLDMLISKTVQIVLDKKIIKSKSIIVDATHTKARYNQKTPRQALQEQSKKLRRTVYEVDETMKEKFPNKNTEDSLEKELEYCKQLLSIVKDNEDVCSYPKVQEKLNLLEESVNDDLEHLETSKDNDAKIGHKTADTSFFGYKTHIAMTEERIITAATITSGEKTDGKELPALVRKSRAAGMKVETVIGDKAYSSKENIDAAKVERQIIQPEMPPRPGYDIFSQLIQHRQNGNDHHGLPSPGGIPFSKSQSHKDKDQNRGGQPEKMTGPEAGKTAAWVYTVSRLAKIGHYPLDGVFHSVLSISCQASPPQLEADMPRSQNPICSYIGTF